jgi:hypothetical protein
MVNALQRSVSGARVLLLNLYRTRQPNYPTEGEGHWGETELRHRLTSMATAHGSPAPIRRGIAFSSRTVEPAAPSGPAKLNRPSWN